MTIFDAMPDNACPGYIALRRGENIWCQIGREHCEDLWQTFAPLADDNFMAEFAIHLHERWFEMYLAVALIRAGHEVQSSKPGPDILLTVDGRRIWIEATCASAGEAEKPDSVPQLKCAELSEKIIVAEVPTDEMTLRIRNSLHTKEKKYRDYITKGIVRQEDVTAVAINVREIGRPWADIDDLMRRTLYGLGDLMLTINRETGETIDQTHKHRPQIQKKSSKKSLVGVEPFTDGSLSHISAVIASWEDAVSRPARLGDGLTLFPNISACVRWPAGTIRLGCEWTSALKDNGDGQLTKVSFIT
jgi:hypothetical protein